MPAVTLLSNPNGAPMAATHSPGFKSLALPIFTTGKSAASILSSATSDCWSEPISLAVYSRLSLSITLMLFMPPTTCVLVRM